MQAQPLPSLEELLDDAADDDDDDDDEDEAREGGAGPGPGSEVSEETRVQR